MGHRRKTGQRGRPGPQAQKQLEWELRRDAGKADRGPARGHKAAVGGAQLSEAHF